jgi:hypothetical protein
MIATVLNDSKKQNIYLAAIRKGRVELSVLQTFLLKT